MPLLAGRAQYRPQRNTIKISPINAMAITPNDTDTTVAVEYFPDDDGDAGGIDEEGLSVGLNVGASVSDGVSFRTLGRWSIRGKLPRCLSR